MNKAIRFHEIGGADVLKFETDGVADAFGRFAFPHQARLRDGGAFVIVAGEADIEVGQGPQVARSRRCSRTARSPLYAR